MIVHVIEYVGQDAHLEARVPDGFVVHNVAVRALHQRDLSVRQQKCEKE
jgi:hypothetical protein